MISQSIWNSKDMTRNSIPKILRHCWNAWKRLKGKGKTQSTIFGSNFRKPPLVDVLNLKWSVEFKLLGIYFDSEIKHMDKNYTQALDEIRKVASNWVFKNTTLTGRITVAKTYMLSKVSHVAAILPTPSKGRYLKRKL